MAKIVIDARELRTSTGRYVERLLYYLQNVDKKNEYLVLLKPADFDSWEPASPNFKKYFVLIKSLLSASNWASLGNYIA